MKVLIPTNENDITSGICPSFARAPFFMIWDSGSKEASFIENLAASSSGGAGVKAAQIVVDTKVEALLTPRIGKNAADVLEVGNITIYHSVSKDITINLDLLLDKKLQILTNIHPGFHGMGE